MRAGAAGGQHVHGQQSGGAMRDAGAMAAPTEQTAQLPHVFWCGGSSSGAGSWTAACPSGEAGAGSPWQGGFAASCPDCWAAAGTAPCAQRIAAAAYPWKGTASRTSQSRRVRMNVFTRAF
jgi:hypothetical protein